MILQVTFIYDCFQLILINLLTLLALEAAKQNTINIFITLSPQNLLNLVILHNLFFAFTSLPYINSTVCYFSRLLK